MRRPRLFWRIYATYVLVVLLCTASVGITAVRSAQSFYSAHMQDELEARAYLVREQVAAQADEPVGEPLELLVRRLGMASGTRLTIISTGRPGEALGAVLADSDVPAGQMENHGDRPEFRAALDGRTGVAVRVSPTVGEETMYVAVPVTEDGRVVAVVRAAVPTRTVSDALDRLYARIVAGALVIGVVAAAIGLLVSSRISRQMRDITAGAEAFAAGDFAHKLYVPRTQEFAAVAESLNRMAAQLDERMRTLTRERNERDAVLSSMVEGVLAVDGEERVIAMNEAAADLLSVDVEEAEGKVIQEVVRNPDLQHVVALTLSGGEPVETDILMHVGHDERALQANGTLLHGGAEADDVIGAVVVLNDVTRLKRLEEVRSDFVANVSHELKTPVTSIKGFAETLLDGAIDDPEAAGRFLRIIAGQSDRLNSIIEDLLALSALEQRHDAEGLALEEADLCDVIGVSVEVCEGKARVKGMTLSVTCPASLLLPISPPLLEQAVVNLIDNAIKYSPEGTVVEVGAVRAGDEVVISVSDHGQGVAREHLPRLFERFYRVDKARSPDLGGTGLGLAIVKHIAQVHGGRVSVESALGGGSTFRVHLPVTGPPPA